MEVETAVVFEACRLCFRGEGKLLVYGKESQLGKVTAESIYDCVSVRITEDDQLPKGICESCLQAVENWCIFKKICDQAQEILQRQYTKDNLNEENSSTTGNEDRSCLQRNTTPQNESMAINSLDTSCNPTFLFPSSDSFHNEEGRLNSIPHDEESLNSIPHEDESLNSISHEEEESLNSISHNTENDLRAVRSSEISLPSCSAVVEQESPPTSVCDLNSDSSKLDLHKECDTSLNSGTVDASVLGDIPKSVEFVDLCESSVNSNYDDDNTDQNVDKNIRANYEHNFNDNAISSETGVTDSDGDKTILTILKQTPDKIINCKPLSEDSNSVELLSDLRNDDSNKKSTLVVLDSDKENSIPTSCMNENSNKTEDTLEKMSSSILLPSGEEQIDGFKGAVTIDVNPFPDGSGHFGNQESNSKLNLNFSGGTIHSFESTEVSLEPEKSQPKESNEFASMEAELVSSSVSPSAQMEGEEEVSSSMEKESNVLPDASEEPLQISHGQPSDTSNELRVEEESIQGTPIKQEPIDSTTENDPSHPQFHVRVKSEFSSFHFSQGYMEEPPHEVPNPAKRLSQCNPDDPNNSECFICNRKYSSVSNYKQHLLTKMHLFNSGQLVEPPPSAPREPPKELPSAFESPLLRSRLSSDPLNKPSYTEPASPPLPPPLPASPSPKRRYIDHCRLCNVSFTYISELRKHLLSKKHRLNVKIARYRGLQSDQILSRRPVPSQPVKPVQYTRELSPVNPYTQGTGKSIFICPLPNCNFSCVKGESLLFHMKVHGVQQPLENSVNEKFGEAKQKLSMRHMDFSKEAEMKIKKEAELKQFHEQKILREQIQRQQQMQSQQLMQSQQQIQNQQQMQSDLGLYECKGCNKRFVRASGLKKHAWYCVHQPETLKVNEMDDDEFDEEEEVFSQNEDSQGSSESSHCPLCNINFTARNVFINHVQIYHKGSYLESDLAKKPELGQKIIEKHPVRPNNSTRMPGLHVPNKMRVTNKTHGFSCDICGRKFNLLTSFNMHMKTHTVSVRHICRICKEPFTNRRAFMEHCRQHFLKPGSKETLCHKCFKVFKTRSELYQHRKNDQCSIKMKIYSCNICQHSFKDPATLEEHKVRHHAESFDIAEDDPSFISEIYEDEDDDDAINLEDAENENLPGTSSRGIDYPNIPQIPTKKLMTKSLNYASAKSPNYMVRNSPTYTPSPPPAEPPLSCSLCNTNFSSKQSLKKHTIKFHVLNKPYLGSNRHGGPRQRNNHQKSSMKSWKCRHCKQAFMTRKVLVNHLKRCEYNSIQDTKGLCLQCGKMCESGKTRICQLCLPSIARDPDFNEDLVRELKRQQMASQDCSQIGSQSPKIVKWEYEASPKLPENKDILSNQNYLSHHSNPTSVQKPAGCTKEALLSTEQNDTSNLQAAKNREIFSIDDIVLMKCPAGNKYFRNEMLMVRHYSECDGQCENRCSHCRKLFNSAKEYKQHLIFSKCFRNKNKNKKKTKLRYPTFACKKKKVRKDPHAQIGHLIPRVDVTDIKSLRPDIEKLTDDFSDNTMDMSTYSEENSSIGMESSCSTSFISKAVEEKSMKMGRICSICNKVLTTQRAVYRHAYTCIKTILLHKDSVSCPKCNKEFRKAFSMKENTSLIRQHIIGCHFLPYYPGEGLREDGSRLNEPPEQFCYICSFGFSSHRNLMVHIKDHRTKKDEVNNIVLLLEGKLLSDERMADKKSMFSFYIDGIDIPDLSISDVHAVSSLESQHDILSRKKCMTNTYQCDQCTRIFCNKKKYLRHKRVHGIITQNVFNQTRDESYMGLENDNALLNET